MKTLRSIALGTAIGMSAAVCAAGTASSFFSVQITLHTGIVTPPVTGPPVILPPPPPDGGGGGVIPELPPGGGGSVPVTPPVDVVDGGSPTPPPGAVTPAPGPIQVSAPSTGICTSQSASDATQAIVRVVCSTGQFVSIESSPGRPFVGTHGGAYRFNFGPGLPAPALASNFNLNIGAGTVTALRILHINGSQTPLEMLVSF